MKRDNRMVRLLAVAGLACGSTTALLAQERLPTVDVDLARAPLSTWVGALASACDTVAVDSTWRPVDVPKSNVSLLLPQRLIAQGEILTGAFYDFAPRVPKQRYDLSQLDVPLIARLLREQATATIRCPSSEPSGPSIWVMGFEASHPSEPLMRGVWNVVGVWRHEPDHLYGLSRDLWGARALVNGMRLRVVRSDSVAKR